MQRLAVRTLGEPRFHLPVPPRGATPRCVDDDVWVRDDPEVRGDVAAGEEVLFEKAGPRSRLFFDPAKTKLAVATCGGLCPGLNAVIRSIVLEAHHNYGVPEVLGVRYGYQGLNPAVGLPPLRLDPELVDRIHHTGGTVLGSSRGEQPVSVMVDTLVHWGVGVLFCVGGDGTLRGAHAIADEVARRGLPIAIVGVPKTIDNDIACCDRTFGYATAVERASVALRDAHTEAKGVRRGIGLVKVMGRDAGFIACGAALASGEANFVLIPESPFALDGPAGFLAALEERMDRRDHAVIVVAEGAGQDLFAANHTDRDASGNPRYHDIGVHLKGVIDGHFRGLGKPVSIKYIDPSYLIRSVPADPNDAVLCDEYARAAVHAALAGKTDLLIGYRNQRLIHVPIEAVVSQKRRVDPCGPLWHAVLAATGQPAAFH